MTAHQPITRPATALDDALAVILQRAFDSPASVPRIVRCPLVPRGEPMEVPGGVWRDGMARLIAHPRDRFDLTAVSTRLAAWDVEPGTERSAAA